MLRGRDFDLRGAEDDFEGRGPSYEGRGIELGGAEITLLTRALKRGTVSPCLRGRHIHSEGCEPIVGKIKNIRARTCAGGIMRCRYISPLLTA